MGEEQVSFSCRLDSAKGVTALLSCLSDGKKKDQLAKCEVTEDGITFLVTSRAMYTQAAGELKRELFQAFDCEAGTQRFGINLTTLLECLQVFGPSNLAQTSLSMSYQPEDKTFRLTLEEAGVFTSCEIRTLHEGEDALDYAVLAQVYRRHPERCRMIMRSEYLKEPFQELADFPGASGITVTFCKTSPFFQLAISGAHGTSKVDFPKTSEAFVSFECAAPSTSFTYRLSSFVNGMRALSAAKETLIRINAAGMLCLQHQLPTMHATAAFIDFIISPDGEDEENDNEDAAAAAANPAADPTQDLPASAAAAGADGGDGSDGGEGRRNEEIVLVSLCLYGTEVN